MKTKRILPTDKKMQWAGDDEMVEHTLTIDSEGVVSLHYAEDDFLTDIYVDTFLDMADWIRSVTVKKQTKKKGSK